MARSKLVTLLLGFWLLWATTAARAQRPYGPVIDADGYYPDKVQPFVDFGTFDYDFQIFAPADFSLYGDGPTAPVGAFFTYDRVYLNLSFPDATRPAQAPTFDGQFYWGNRYEFGYMTEESHGWLMSVTHLGGFERVGIEAVVAPGTAKSLDTNFWNVELNKTYRLRLDDGAYMEPFIGARYTYLRDLFIDVAESTISTVFQETQNQMVGGQVGARLFKRKGHWTLSSELRGFAGPNFQFSKTVRDDPLVVEQPRQYLSFDEFVAFVDARLEATYNIRRDFALHVGVQLVYYPTGILRPDVSEVEPADVANLLPGPFPNAASHNDQDMFIGGFTFGFTWNR